MLFEIVEKREGMRGRRPWAAMMFAQDANVWRPLFGPICLAFWADSSGMNLRV